MGSIPIVGTLEDTAKWLATGLENRGGSKGSEFDSSIFRLWW